MDEEIAASVTKPRLNPDIQLLADKSNIVEKVIEESLFSKGRITSKYTLTYDEALELGNKLMGKGYNEVGIPGSGVFEKVMDNKFTYRFRIDMRLLSGNHNPYVPHVHVEILNENRKIVVNNHIPFIN